MSQKCASANVTVLLINAQDLVVDTFCVNSIFLIIFKSKYGLLISTISTASMGVVFGRTAGFGTQNNNYHLSRHLKRLGEGLTI